MSVSVQREDFDVAAEIEAVAERGGDVGAVATFTGFVRCGERGVRAMTLEHYPEMTESALAAIEEEAHLRWPLLASRIVHRFGELCAGERIVLVATASAHRAAAFEAAEFLMDYLKTKAPFWKCEETLEGRRWVEERASDSAAADRWSRSRK